MKKIFLLMCMMFTLVACEPQERYADPLNYKGYMVVDKGHPWVDGHPFFQLCSTDGRRNIEVITVFEYDYVRFGLGDTIK
jgi:hypothetical protein